MQSLRCLGGRADSRNTIDVRPMMHDDTTLHRTVPRVWHEWGLQVLTALSARSATSQVKVVVLLAMTPRSALVGHTASDSSFRTSRYTTAIASLTKMTPQMLNAQLAGAMGVGCLSLICTQTKVLVCVRVDCHLSHSMLLASLGRGRSIAPRVHE
jgi:predicted Zn-dependent protease